VELSFVSQATAYLAAVAVFEPASQFVETAGLKCSARWVRYHTPESRSPQLSQLDSDTIEATGKCL
jgi:hypothetical protein